MRGFSRKTSGSLSTLGKSIGIGVGVAAGAAATAAFLKSIAAVKREFAKQLQDLDEIGKFSDRLGIASEKLAGLKLQAGLAGVSTRELTTSLRTMLRNIGDAAGGVGEATAAFQDLGLSAERMAKLETGDQFKVIAERISRVENKAKQAAIAYRIFGRSGIQLLSALKDGAAGVDASIARARQLGVSVTREQAARAEAANDAMLELRTSLSGLVQQLVIELAPAITVVARALTDGVVASEGLRSALASGAKAGVKGFALFLNTLSIVNRTLKALQSATNTVAIGLTHLVSLLNSLDPTSISDGAAESAEAMREELRKTNKEISDLMKTDFAGTRLEAGIDAIIKEAEELSKQWGVSGREAEIAIDKMEGVGNTSPIDRATDATNAYAAAIASARSEAESLFNSTRTPLEEYASRLERIGALKSSGAISGDLAGRSVRSLAKEVARAGDSASIARFRQFILEMRNPIKFQAFSELEIAIQGVRRAAESVRLDQLRDDAAAIIESTLTPLERARREYQKLKELLKEGLISREVANRALAEIREGLKPEEEAPVAGSAASSRATSLSRSVLTSGIPVQVNKKQQVEDKESKQLLEKIESNTRQSGARAA